MKYANNNKVVSGSEPSIKLLQIKINHTLWAVEPLVTEN
jgi:hypothetical protein